MLTIAALSNHGAWEIALVIGLVAALAVAALLAVLIRTVNDIDRSAGALLEVAGSTPTPPTSPSCRPRRRC